MNQKFKKAIRRLLAVVGLLTVLMFCLSPTLRAQVTSTAQNVFGELFGSAVTVLPNGSPSALTNGLTVYDTTGTNFWRINPTNAVPIVFANNTNSIGITNADVIFTNTAGTTRHLIFKNGILVNGSTF